jgi:hypothetical protein
VDVASVSAAAVGRNSQPPTPAPSSTQSNDSQILAPASPSDLATTATINPLEIVNSGDGDNGENSSQLNLGSSSTAFTLLAVAVAVVALFLGSMGVWWTVCHKKRAAEMEKERASSMDEPTTVDAVEMEIRNDEPPSSMKLLQAAAAAAAAGAEAFSKAEF